MYVCMYAGIQPSHLSRQKRQFVIDVRVHIWKPHLQTESFATPTCHDCNTVSDVCVQAGLDYTLSYTEYTQIFKC